MGNGHVRRPDADGQRRTSSVKRAPSLVNRGQPQLVDAWVKVGTLFRWGKQLLSSERSERLKVHTDQMRALELATLGVCCDAVRLGLPKTTE